MTRRVRCGARAGVALPAALLAMLVGALVAAGALARAAAAAREARLAGAVARAEAAARAGVAVALRDWDAEWAAGAPPGSSRATDVVTAAGRATVRVARLDDARWLVAADAATRAPVPGGRARRLVARLAVAPRVALDPQAAALVGGALDVAAGAALVGADAAPDGWSECLAPSDPRPALRHAPATPPVVAGTVDGAVVADPAAADAASYARFGEADLAHLARVADVVVPAGATLAPVPRATDGVCARDAWGEPWRGGGAVTPCAGRAPLVHVRGAGRTVLRAPARWQGVLLVDGDLAIEGAVEGAGVLVVQGTLDASAGALRLAGALLVRGDVRLGSGSRVARSACAVGRAARAAGKPTARGRRSWFEVTP